MLKKYYILFPSLFILLIYSFANCTVADVIDIDVIPPEYKVEYELDVVYSSTVDADKSIVDLKMDIFYPVFNEITEKRPLIILIHGGSFMKGFGGKESCRNWANILAGKGYVVSSIEYRLWRGITSVFKAIKAAIYDAHAAIRYFRANAELWNIDSDRILIGGYSAGASVALYVAYYPEIPGNDNFSNSEFSSDVFAVISVSGSWGPGQSANYMDEGEPGICIFHGTRDMVVSVREAYETMDQADSMGVYAESYIYNKASHNLLSIKINEISMRIDEFYKTITKK